MIQNAIHEFNKDKYHPETVIGEFSGRDSVAAIIKAFESEDINYILPIATFAGTEYGNFDMIYENYMHLQLRVQDLYGENKVLYPLMEYNREDIWAILNGRVGTLINQKFSFYTPCIGCHLYFHLTKLPFAKVLSGRIISGERESHDGKKKVNQLGITLDVYTEIIQSFGCNLLMPLRHVTDGHAVETLIGWDWKEGSDHPACVLSGNYRDARGKAIYDAYFLNKYLHDFLKPASKLVGQFLIENKEDTESFKTMKKEVLALL